MVRFRNKFGRTLCLSLNNIWWKHIYNSNKKIVEKIFLVDYNHFTPEGHIEVKGLKLAALT